MSWHNLTFQETGWGFLYGLADLKNGGTARPGEKFMYGRQDPETEEPYLYTVEGKDPKTGAYKISRDYEASLVYPERLFVWGSDDDNKTPLSHSVLYDYLKQMGIRAEGFWEPVRLHRGYAGGEITWYHALRAHTDVGTTYYSEASKIRTMMEEWNGYSPFSGRTEFTIKIP